MKKLYKRVFVLVVCILLVNKAWSQSGNSNIGTEFWTAYMVHINGATGASASQMILYIASDVATTGTVTVTDGSFSPINFSVTPNVATLVPIPAAAYLGNVDGTQSKGLHIVSKNPIAVYGHIYASSVSGATLLLPVNTMANDYYSLNFTQLSNASPSYSAFMVIATEDNTSIEITPSAALIDGSKANIKFTITLNKGQVYQGLSNTDLTGSHIVSVSNGSGCKKIAVFSGSNKIYIGSPNSSSDNLFQQVYPTASWGKNYITVPLKTRNYDVFRVVLSDPATTVTVDGVVIPLASFTNGLYYQFTSQATHVITGNKPIQVVQYAVTQGDGITGKTVAGDIGDPEMIYLNPLEQNIDHVTLYSTNKYLILNGFINVVIPTAATSSFLLDGAVPTTSFTAVPGITGYSYGQFPVSVGATHNISASQGFNAIAYGFGSAESYGYAAGTNVKNLNEFTQFASPGTKQAIASGCTGGSIEPQVVLPYQTTNITWDFGNGTTPVSQANPVYKDTLHRNNNTLYVYDYGQAITYPAAGTYAVSVTVVDPITTVCGSNEIVSLNYTISDPPQPKFASRDSICVNDTIGFKDQSIGSGTINGWHYTFGNGDTSSVKNPVYKYLTPGDYTVGLTITLSSSCPTASITKNVHVRALPVAAFSFSSPDCETLGVTISDASTTAEGKITQWIWDYGDGSPIDTKTGATLFTHTYATAGTYTIKLQVLTDKGCTGATASHTITIHPHPVVDFGLPDVCLANAVASFTDKTTISDNSNAQFKYLWDFGDVNATASNPNTSTLKNPTHQFIAGGNYTVSLSVTSKDTCTLITTKTYLVSGQANFSAATSACPADTVVFTDKTNGTTPATTSWHWDFGTGDTSNVQNPKYFFKAPGDYTVKLTVAGHAGCSVTSYSSNVHIYKKPVANFIYSTIDCETGQVTLTDKSTSTEGTLAQWVWDYGDGSALDMRTSAAPFTHVYATAGTYIIKLYTVTNFGCSSITFSKSILVHPKPVVDFGLPDVCLTNATASFTDKSTIADTSSAKFKYLWNFGDANATPANPNTSILKNPSHKFTSAGNYTISLTVTSKDTCSATATKTYVVSGQANFSAPANACPTDSVQFTDKSDGATPASSAWHWVFGTTGDTSNVQNPKYAFKNPGNYTVTLTVTGHNGCTTTNYSSAIHIYTRPVANFAYSGVDCETGQVTFTDRSTSTDGTNAQWVWDYGDGSALDIRTTNTAFPHTYAKAGTYIVKLYTVTTLGCASAAVSKSLLIHPKPVVDFGLPDVCLANAVATFTDKSNIADSSSAKFKYLWNFGDGYATGSNPNTSIVKNPTHQYTRAGTYSTSLTVTSKDTCSSVTTKTFVISGQANFTAAANACPADSVIFTDKSDGATKASSAWHWVFGTTGDTSNVQNPKYAFKNPGNYTVTLTVTGHNGCSTTNYSAGIHIYTKPVANFTYSTIDCETKQITFTDQSTSTEGTNVQWIWDYGDGSMLDVRTSAAAFTHTFAKYGTYNVKLYTVSSLGCASVTLLKAIQVNPLPTKDFTIPDVCLADTYAQFTAISTIADNTTSTYAWDFGDPARSTIANPNTATGLTVKHKYTATGNYSVRLTITSAKGCVVDTLKQFTVNGSSPQSKFVVLNSATLCSNRDVFFVDSASVPGFGNGSVTSVDMYYDYANSPTVKVHYARPTYGQLFRHTYKQDSLSHTYQVVMDAFSGGTCVNRSSQSITVLGVPTITFPKVASVCVNADPFQLSIVQHGPTGTPGAVYTGTGVGSTGIFNPAIAGVGTHVIQCIYTSANSCADTLMQTVTVEPVATISAGPDVVVLAGGHTTIKATATGSNLTYLWTPSAGLDRIDILQPVAAPSINTKYTLIVTSTTAGVQCAVTSSVTVRVLQAPLVPTSFTPNGDGINDTWIIQNLDTYPGATVDVFNRNGEKVFSSVGYSIPWDGRYNGINLPVGTYYYIIDPKNGRAKLSGYIAIIR